MENADSETHLDVVRRHQNRCNVMRAQRGTSKVDLDIMESFLQGLVSELRECG